MSNYYAFNTRKERCPIDSINFNYSGGTLPGGSYTAGACSVPAGGRAILRFTKSGNTPIVSVLGVQSYYIDNQGSMAITAFHPHIGGSVDYYEVEVFNVTDKARSVRDGAVDATVLCMP